MHEGMPRKQRTTAPDALEHAYRQSVLHDIERRIARYGEHKATPHADRARQFVPFAALKGYEDMAHSRELATAARHELTAEESRLFSETAASLSKGDAVRVAYYRQGAHRTAEGAFVDKDEARRTIRIGSTDIPFDDIESIERVRKSRRPGG